MKNILIPLMIVLLLSSCSSDSTDDLTVPVPEVITYTQHVKQIMDTSCATSGCHSTNSNAANLVLENYVQVKQAFENRNALGRMKSTTNPMPSSGNLPSTTIQLIENWMNQGYLEN